MPGGPSFDAAQVADAYSQLSGVIAGFAFSSIVVLLTYQIGAAREGRKTDGRMQSALLLLFSCFMGMTTSSLAYSVLSGMKEFARALEVGHVVAGTGFGVSGLMGLLGIHQLILCSNLRIEREIGIVSGSLAPLLITAYQVAGLHQVGDSAATVFGVCAVVAVLAVASVAPHLKESGAERPEKSPSAYSTLSIAGLGVSSIPSLVVSILAAAGGTADVPVWPAYAAIVATFLMCSWVMVTFQREVGRSPSAPMAG
ncbi:hypothetical protein BC793_106340 [Actinoplanes xinjiangensis]|uniref:Uncharacterized protein n=1 Tax=Actinoplanes xinjiangensis TaxID=512350 RepID=A0A316FKJ9_9ACTN|nr:hypothetical protein BC793_106340 [Actinoplanes xinjiangensis]GIF38935.1 hypothetical protein Axi01nite_32460 [Actinoplanes xinjiangensis]